MTKLVAPSQPYCPVQETCGGCPLLHTPRENELEQKRQRIETAFHRIGIDTPVDETVHAAERIGYRNRHRMAVTDGIVHFFNQAKSGGCLVLRPELWSSLEHLKSASEANSELLRHASHLEVRVSDEPSAVGLRLANKQPESALHNQKELQTLLGDNWRIATHNDTAHQSDVQPTLRYNLGNGVTSDVPLNAFVQVNSTVNRLLLHHIVETTQWRGVQTFLDLYAGAGNLSLPLLNAGMTGIAIEQTVTAIQTLSKHRLAKGLSVVAGDVHTSLQSLRPVDLVVCNPPRSGIKQGYRSIASLAEKMVLLVSCDPETLASDVTQLLPYGFTLKQLTPFDMFPGTTHIETVAALCR